MEREQTQKPEPSANNVRDPTAHTGLLLLHVINPEITESATTPNSTKSTPPLLVFFFFLACEIQQSINVQKSHKIAEIQQPYQKENLNFEFKFFQSIRFPP
uniref:Uncharacterized protein n=1 Tax=Solanum tuberosum TaxID=4113 RepID=M1D1D8_SOLTU